jgi:hypothetical protein
MSIAYDPSHYKTRMPMEVKAKWLAALRSGEYRQGYGGWLCDDVGQHCCLGVLEHALDHKIERYAGSTDTPSVQLPSFDWLDDHNITSTKGTSYKDIKPCNDFYFFLPESSRPKGFDSSKDCDEGNGFFCASNLNDVYAYSFAQIADLVEEQVEGF